MLENNKDLSSTKKNSILNKEVATDNESISMIYTSIMSLESLSTLPVDSLKLANKRINEKINLEKALISPIILPKKILNSLPVTTFENLSSMPYCS